MLAIQIVFVAGREPEEAIKHLNQNYQIYKSVEQQLLQRKARMLSKVPDLRKAIEMVQMLIDKQGEEVRRAWNPINPQYILLVKHRDTMSTASHISFKQAFGRCNTSCACHNRTAPIWIARSSFVPQVQASVYISCQKGKAIWKCTLIGFEIGIACIETALFCQGLQSLCIRKLLISDECYRTSYTPWYLFHVADESGLQPVRTDLCHCSIKGCQNCQALVRGRNHVGVWIGRGKEFAGKIITIVISSNMLSIISSSEYQRLIHVIYVSVPKLLHLDE